jgi:hypothetical protein
VVLMSVLTAISEASGQCFLENVNQQHSGVGDFLCLQHCSSVFRSKYSGLYREWDLTVQDPAAGQFPQR